jgi:hypothetical protein
MKRDRRFVPSRSQCRQASRPAKADRPTRRHSPSRKDHAAHVSLPSDAIVKQRGLDLEPGTSLARGACALSGKIKFQPLRPGGPGPKTIKTSPPASQQVGGSIVPIPEHKPAARRGNVVGPSAIGQVGFRCQTLF